MIHAMCHMRIFSSLCGCKCVDVHVMCVYVCMCCVTCTCTGEKFTIIEDEAETQRIADYQKCKQHVCASVQRMSWLAHVCACRCVMWTACRAATDAHAHVHVAVCSTQRSQDHHQTQGWERYV